MTTPLDPRRHPIRDDLAAEYLQPRVVAPRYVRGETERISVAVTVIRPAPDPLAPAISEALHGEGFSVYDRAGANDGEWSWGQLETDGYVGWVASADLAKDTPIPTHRVRVLRTLRFPEPELKSPPVMALSMNSRVAVASMTVTRGLRFALLADGSAIPASHLVPVGVYETDFPAVALKYLGAPYLWGGRSSLGVDCSGLVQVALADCGLAAPRDSDMQEAELGEDIGLPGPDRGIRRGDLMFWTGHVAIGLGEGEMVHANAHHMAVVRERIEPALERMAAVGSELRRIRRVVV